MTDNGNREPELQKFLGSPAGKQVPTIVEDISEFVVALGKEGDRSAVIIGATKIDVELEELLKAILHPAVGGRDDLFDNERPLSTFSAKTSIAFRLGIIDRDLEHAIQLVRRIRNEFAHTLQQASLSNPPHRERVSRLSRYFHEDELWKEVTSILTKRGDSSHLAEFAASLGCIIRTLKMGTLFNKRLSVSHQCRLSSMEKK
jgi:hypothetical protein